MANRKVIVTGGAGFIGSNLIHRLNREGLDHIIVVDNLTNADKCRNLVRCRFTDLLDKEDLLLALDRIGPIEAIFHLGACSSTTEQDGRYLLRNNVDYSKRLLAWCQANGARLLYASSASVYGNADAGFDDNAPEKAEDPLNGYAFSKWVFDQHVRRLAAAGALRHQVIGLRYFNVYGRQEMHKKGMCSPILHFHRQLIDKNELRLFAGSDVFRRDFVTVEDCCAVNMHFYHNPETSGIFNCGTGEACSFAKVAGCVASRYPGSSIVDIPFPDHLKGKYQRHTCADLTRLRRAGYVAAFTSIDQGIADYIDALKGPRQGYL